jgi:hypothetical protein
MLVARPVRVGGLRLRGRGQLEEGWLVLLSCPSPTHASHAWLPRALRVNAEVPASFRPLLPPTPLVKLRVDLNDDGVFSTFLIPISTLAEGEKTAYCSPKRRCFLGWPSVGVTVVRYHSGLAPEYVQKHSPFIGVHHTNPPPLIHAVFQLHVAFSPLYHLARSSLSVHVHCAQAKVMVKINPSV